MAEGWIEIEAIKQLKARYFRFLDTQCWDEFEGLFAPDCPVLFPEIDAHYSSGAEFVAFARDVMKGVVSVHAGYMPEIVLNDDGTAQGIWAMSDDLDAPDGMPQSGGKPVRMRGAGHYHERYVKIDGEWKFASMTLNRLRLDVSA